MLLEELISCNVADYNLGNLSIFLAATEHNEAHLKDFRK